MVFNWMTAVILAIMAYACLYYWIKTKKILPHVFGFMGPCLLIKTQRVKIFDKLARWKKLLIAYATAGIVLTVISGIILTILFVISAITTLMIKPEPVALQNLLMIPGLNQYVPSTVSVWLALVIALIIHEGGHGILSRAENIKVKSTGILACVVPIGAFVEPDEEDIEKSPLKTKLRMFAAGITNNLVFGLICLILLAILLGFVVPGEHPYVYGVYAGFPAEEAGVIPGTVVYSINDVSVYSMSDISMALNGTKAGDIVSLQGEYKGNACSYDITLSSLPSSLSDSAITNSTMGFMGISFNHPENIMAMVDTLIHPSSPLGAVSSFLYFFIFPFKTLSGMETLSFITADYPDNELLTVPFPGFWGIIHFLFWCAWINVLLGVFNALPIRSLDGGQMLREVLRSLCRKFHKPETIAYQITGGISTFIIILLVMCIFVPYLF